MNLLPATVGDGVLQAGAMRLPLPAGVTGVMVGTGVEVGLRPEHVRLAVEGSDEVCRGVVVGVEMAGSDTYLQVDIGDAELTVRWSGDDRPAVGATVGLAVDAGRLHLFDRATGAAVR